MAIPPKDGNLIYHLTSISNLESIFKEGLQARSQVDGHLDIADQEIINHRELNHLNDYVPFHFFPKSPFAGIVMKQHSEKKFVYITVQRSTAKANDYKILTQHPLSCPTCIPLDYDSGIQAIDWDTMNSKNYHDHESKMVCMAECLSKATVSVNDFHCIYCRTIEDKTEVEKIWSKFSSIIKKPYITVNKYMFVTK